MKMSKFEHALMSTIVEYISDQIVLKYMNASKTATVLFSGALIGYGDAVASLKAMKEDGWKLTAVLSKAASEVLTEERIKNDIGPDAIYVEGNPVNGRKIVDDNQYVLIPCLTINTAAKVANCICDNLLTDMIVRAMTTGKPIVAAIDGCCPDSEVRAKIGFKVTEAYKKRMRQNLVDLQEYGLILTTAKNLEKKTSKIFEASFDFAAPSGDSAVEMKSIMQFVDVSKVLDMGALMSNTMQILDTKKKNPMIASVMESAPVSTASPAMPQETNDSIRLNKKVIGRADIAKNARYKTVIVSADTLVTGLAKDEAYQRHMTIVVE